MADYYIISINPGRWMSGIEIPIAKYHFMLLLIIFYMYIFIARWKTNYQVMEG